MSAPEAMTFNSLKTDIQGYAERNDPGFVSQLDRIIMLAENRLAAEVKGLGAVRVVNGTFRAGSPLLEKPQRWRQTREFLVYSLSGTSYLRPRKYSYCREYQFGGESGVPEFYSNLDLNHYYVAPLPLLGYTFELSYHEKPEPLSTSNPTNWITQYAPQLLLYACLLEAQPFLKNAQLLSLWQSQYAQALSSIQTERSSDNHDLTEATS